MSDELLRQTERGAADAEQFTRLGYQRLRTGDHTPAIDAFRQSLELAPSFEAAQGLNSILHQDPQNSCARELLTQHYPLGWTGLVRIARDLCIDVHEPGQSTYRLDLARPLLESDIDAADPLDNIVTAGGKLAVSTNAYRGGLFCINEGYITREGDEFEEHVNLIELPEIKNYGIVRGRIVSSPDGTTIYELTHPPLVNLEGRILLQPYSHSELFDRGNSLTELFAQVSFHWKSTGNTSTHKLSCLAGDEFHAEDDSVFFYQPRHDKYVHEDDSAPGEIKYTAARDSSALPQLKVPKGTRWAKKQPVNIARNEFELLRNTTGNKTIEVPITVLESLRRLREGAE